MSSSSSSSSSGISIPQHPAPPWPAMHTLSLPAASRSSILATLAPHLRGADGSQSAPTPTLSRLDVSHAPLGDQGLRELLGCLGGERWDEGLIRVAEAVLLDGDGSAGDAGEPSEQETQRSARAPSDASAAVAGSAAPLPAHEAQRGLKLRSLQLTDTQLTCASLPLLAAYVRGNAALTTLELQGNSLGGDPAALSAFARALFFSPLRHLHLASSALDVGSFTSFLNSLRSASLRQLHLSVSLPLLSGADARAAASAVAALLRRSREAPAGGAGWAPQLERLSLNGNEFTWRGVRRIVAAVLGALPPGTPGAEDPPRPNRTLLHLELFATMSDERGAASSSASDDDEDGDDEEQAERQRGGVAHRAGRPLSISSSLRAQAQEARARFAAAAGGASATPGGVTPPRIGAAEAARRTPILLRERRRDDSRTGTADDWQPLNWQPLGSASFADAQAPLPQTAGDLYKQITRADWRRLLGAQLWRNASARADVQGAALNVLAAVRVVGCRSYERGEEGYGAANAEDGTSIPDLSSESFPFVRLPLELRLAILRHLDPCRVLSEAQFARVVAWACDASTIGYGCGYGVCMPLLSSSSDDGDAASRAASPQGLLPAHPWDWRASLLRSAPRDWAAELLDRPKEALGEGWSGGGGGPDGEGGARTRRREVCQGMCAFWECTGTEGPE